MAIVFDVERVIRWDNERNEMRPVFAVTARIKGNQGTTYKSEGPLYVQHQDIYEAQSLLKERLINGLDRGAEVFPDG